MIWQRALAWAAVLALVATVSIAPLPARILALVVALAQDDSATDAGEPTDLAVVALNCAEAPNTEALTSFFTDGTPPNECAPPRSDRLRHGEWGSGPRQPVHDRRLRYGHAPRQPGLRDRGERRPEVAAGWIRALTQEANGVPYANPVQLDRR